MDRNQTVAAEFWAAQSREERKKILAALKADEAVAEHDFAALAPEVRAGVTAGLKPAEEAEKTESGGDDDEHPTRGRRR